jgi:hypothetical protein
VEKLVWYAKALVEEAKAIEAKAYSRDVRERQTLPLIDPPKSWIPGKYREEFCKSLYAGVCKLRNIAKSIRADGVHRVTHASRGEVEIGRYAIVDLQEAITDVERFLRQEVL